MDCMMMSLTSVPAQRVQVLQQPGLTYSTDIISAVPRVHICLGAQENILISFKIRRKKTKLLGLRKCLNI